MSAPGIPLPRLEVWASPEPTIARVSESIVRDQLAETGHAARFGDLDLLAELGVGVTRYPVLWEMAAPDDPATIDLAWATRRLHGLRERRIEPIVTLLHHGSGPRYTSLLDDAFPERFAAYAAAVARRFPWVRRWTPINEPLTTARFAMLYGAWFPNRTLDHRAFGRAMTLQALATRAAMRAIRREIPRAQLVLTEDAQRFVAGDADVAAYVERKRERSYLSAELLLGRIVRGTPMWRYLTERCGVAARTLDDLAADPAPPDLVGCNYYPNSERYVATGCDGRSVNVPNVHRAADGISPRPLLRAIHARLRVPLALSEVHVHASEAERVRWLVQRYDDVVALRDEGVPVLAIGPWAAFGSVDWRSLLRARAGVREDGIYTCVPATRTPRPTAVAHAVRSLARGVRPAMPPALGWWERADRLRSYEEFLRPPLDDAAAEEVAEEIA